MVTKKSLQAHGSHSPKDFGIVIPHLDHSDHLKICLNSILTQEGSDTVHIHVQDGGNSERPKAIIRELVSGLDSARFTVTYSQENDGGAAQAINRGLTRIDAKMLSWLGADDLLLPGALSTVSSFIRTYHDYGWVTGLPHVITENGVVIPRLGSEGIYRRPTGYSQNALRLGLHAGESNHGFIQQEGTFWSRQLWDQVGGVDEELRLAFDFDLWCKLANHAPLIELVAPLAAFRKRRGQASENVAAYQKEVATIRKRAATEMPVRRRRFELTYVAFTHPKKHDWHIIRKKFVIAGSPMHSILQVFFSKPDMRYRLEAVLRRRAARSRLIRRLIQAAGTLLKWTSNQTQNRNLNRP